MKQAVVYLRVSGASQVLEGGFERQEASCRGLAAGKGFEVVRVFREEGVSGTKESGDRPGYKAMLAFMGESGVDVVIVEHLDRLARFYRVQETLLIDLLDRGFTLYTANTGENVTESIEASPMRKFVVQLQGLISELDRSQIVLKLNKGRQRVREAGGKAEGQYAYGTDPKRPEEAPMLADMMAWKADGRTCEFIASQLNQMLVKGRSGCVWSPATVAKILRRQQGGEIQV